MNATFLALAFAGVTTTAPTSEPAVDNPHPSSLSPPPLISVWSASDNPADVPVFQKAQGPSAPAAPTALAAAVVAPKEARMTELSANTQTSVSAQAKPRASSQFAAWGLALDAGVPDFAGANLTVRPFRSHGLRLEGGVFSPGSGAGIRGGVTLVPFHWAIRLTLTAEGGHYFRHNLNPVLKMFGAGSVPDAVSTVLSSLSYQFANAHAGLEFGGANFGIYLRGGLSYVDFTFDKAVAALPSGEMGTFTGDPVSVRATLPTVKLGFNFYFL